MTARENATEELLYFIDRFMGEGKNREIYRKRLAALSDAEFEAFIEGLESGEEVLALFCPNTADYHVTVEQNMVVAEELGHPLYQYLYLTDPDTGQIRKTPIKHLVIDLPLRRQAQMLYKKMSIPENNHVIDERSGQATGPSKGARMSYPEIQINAGKGLDNALLEMIKIRGGDSKAYQAMVRQIHETGDASIEAIQKHQPSRVKATDTLSTYLTASMLKNNL